MLTSAVIPLLAFMTVSTGAAQVFEWFVNLVSIAQIIFAYWPGVRDGPA